MPVFIELDFQRLLKKPLPKTVRFRYNAVAVLRQLKA
jgi:hypothetical protein